MSAAILAENLSMRYDNIVALNHINFTIEEGQIFGFIGPDGAGKTSLFRILTTLIHPSEGSAKILGYDSVKDFHQIRKICGYMPGKFSLYPDLSVEENLKFFASIFQSNITENIHLIKDIYQQIEPFKNRKAGKLSGGMKQKLALSCALIHKPEILFLDEPTTGVDPVSRQEFWEMLKRLKKDGLTIVVSTPYMDEASQCDQIAMLYNGNILAEAAPDQIKKLHNEALFSLRGKNTYPLLKFLRQILYVKSAYPFGQTIHFTLNNSKNITIVKELLERQFGELNIMPIEPEIEDVFLFLSQKI